MWSLQFRQWDTCDKFYNFDVMYVEYRHARVQKGPAKGPSRSVVKTTTQGGGLGLQLQPPGGLGLQ